MNNNNSDVKQNQIEFQENTTENTQTLNSITNDKCKKPRGTCYKKSAELNQRKRKHDKSQINSSTKHVSNSNNKKSTNVQISQPVKSQTLLKKQGTSIFNDDINKCNDNLTDPAEQIIIGPLCSTLPNNKQGNKEIRKKSEPPSCLLPNKENNKEIRKNSETPSCLLPNKQHNKEIRKISETPTCLLPNKENNKEIRKSSETPSKGIRIRMGGTVYRITGKDTQTGGANVLDKDVSVQSSCKETDVTRRLSSEDKNSASKLLKLKNTSDLPKNNKSNVQSKNSVTSEGKICKIMKLGNKFKNSNTNASLTIQPNVNNKNEDSTSSSEDSSSSDTTNEDSSDSSDSSEESNDARDILHSNESVPLISKGSVENNQINVKKCSVTKHLNSSQDATSSNLVIRISSNSMNEIEKKLSASEDSSNSDSDCVIVLSGSSDVDNCDHKNTKECSENKEESLASKEDDCNNVLSACNVGRIRVRSLQELCVTKDEPLPGNTLKSNDLTPYTSELNEHQSSTPQLLVSDDSPNLHDDEMNEITNHQSANLDSLKNQPEISNNLIEKSFASENQVQPNKSDTLTESVPNLQKGAVIAIIRPVNSEQPVSLKTSSSKISVAGDKTEINENQKDQPSTNQPKSLLFQVRLSESLQTPNSTSQEHAIKDNRIIVQIGVPEKKTQELFFKLCNELFTELVYFKIPKLVDDLHLLISYNIMKEERLKKIEQLVCSEIKLTEKRRVEKESAEVLKIRAQSFVPLFVTILNKINKVNFKALVTALYCKIVQQLERIDPVNNNYRYKLRHIIKNLIQKHSYKGNEAVCSILDESDERFIKNFFFIEYLLREYDKYLEERKKVPVENNSNKTSTTSNTNESEHICIVELSDNSNDATTTGNEQTPTKLRNSSDQQLPQTKSPTPPPPIGNLDQIFSDKLLKHITSTKTDTPT